MGINGMGSSFPLMARMSAGIFLFGRVMSISVSKAPLVIFFSSQGLSFLWAFFLSMPPAGCRVPVFRVPALFFLVQWRKTCFEVADPPEFWGFRWFLRRPPGSSFFFSSLCGDLFFLVIYIFPLLRCCCFSIITKPTVFDCTGSPSLLPSSLDAGTPVFEVWPSL